MNRFQFNKSTCMKIYLLNHPSSSCHFSQTLPFKGILTWLQVTHNSKLYVGFTTVQFNLGTNKKDVVLLILIERNSIFFQGSSDAQNSEANFSKNPPWKNQFSLKKNISRLLDQTKIVSGTFVNRTSVSFIELSTVPFYL